MLSKLKTLFILILLAIVFSLFFYSYQINTPLSEDESDILFTIESGQPVKQIAQSLEESKVIRSSFWLRYYLKKKKLSEKVIAGTFSLSSSMSVKEIAKIITTQNSLSNEDQITIIEGWNAKEIGDYLEKKVLCKQKDWLRLISNYKSEDYNFLNNKPKSASLEGYLFPDTYRVYKDSNCQDILDKLLVNFNNKLAEKMRNDIQSQNKTIYEIIIMASLIEKEVRTFDDMKIVSGIFWDRIQYGQALESCATLAYILGKSKIQYSIEDTQIVSRYNTYKYPGLPPGPISNPGLNAINAAIYPKYTQYNYFLSDPKTGETIFSETFEEHKQNKLKYLK